MQAWLNFLTVASKSAANQGHRQVIILAGEQSWGWEKAKSWLNQAPNNAIVSLTKPHDIQGSLLKTNKPNNLLGYDSPNVVFNCHDGLYPDALTAISGTLIAGGLFFVLCPPLADWPSYADAFAIQRNPFNNSQDKQNLVNQSFQGVDNKRMVERIIKKALVHNCYIAEQNSPSEHGISSQKESNRLYSSCQAWLPPKQLTKDQQTTFKAIKSTFTHQPSFCHVISADRGRGKSYLLGKLAFLVDELNVDNGIKFYITAPNKMAIQSVLTGLNENHDSPLQKPFSFLAPEQIFDQVKKDDILFVDEAASLPIGFLIKCSNQFNKLIFASTTHGYEGTGKGFQLRFFKHLETLNKSRGVRHHNLSQPVRYAENDPLENWLFDAFCLDSEPTGLNLPASQFTKMINAPSSQIEVKLELFSQDQLASGHLLHEVFGLLIQAHYQTRPSDLRDMLDAKDFKIFGLFSKQPNIDKVLLSACLISLEGPINNTLTQNTESQPQSTIQQDIFNGLRRPKGHLTPQVLAHHMGLKHALDLRGARIVRIATLPNLQNNNLASRLLSLLIPKLKAFKIDYLASSFANTPDVSQFWVKNQFQCVRIGKKQDAASGSYSALVIKGLSQKGIDLQKEAVSEYERCTLPLKHYSDLSNTQSLLLSAFIDHMGSYESAKQILSRFKDFPLTFPKKANQAFKQSVKDWLENLPNKPSKK